VARDVLDAATLHVFVGRDVRFGGSHSDLSCSAVAFLPGWDY
jgi:hypothetical protein